MSKKPNPNIIKMEFPIFSIIKHRGKYILSGGAGARNVGISDRLVEKNLKLKKIKDNIRR